MTKGHPLPFPSISMNDHSLICRLFDVISTHATVINATGLNNKWSSTSACVFMVVVVVGGSQRKGGEACQTDLIAAWGLTILTTTVTLKHTLERHRLRVHTDKESPFLPNGWETYVGSLAVTRPGQISAQDRKKNNYSWQEVNKGFLGLEHISHYCNVSNCYFFQSQYAQ